MRNVSFGVRLHKAMLENSALCVGIDPHPQLLSSWNLPDTPAGLKEFSLRILDAVSENIIAAVKPQIAFYERHGSAGIAILEETLAAAKDLNILTIMDAKRGDIGSTMEAYAQTFLGKNSTLAADAVTLSPYLGFASLQPALDLAATENKGIFILALTSNTSGTQVQHAKIIDKKFSENNISVAKSIFTQTIAENKKHALKEAVNSLGSLGLVIGATVGDALQQLDININDFNGPILSPGLGAQGATVEDVRKLFGTKYSQILVTSSRDILQAGPDITNLRAKAKKVANYLR